MGDLEKIYQSLFYITAMQCHLSRIYRGLMPCTKETSNSSSHSYCLWLSELPLAQKALPTTSEVPLPSTRHLCPVGCIEILAPQV